MVNDGVHPELQAIPLLRMIAFDRTDRLYIQSLQSAIKAFDVDFVSTNGWPNKCQDKVFLSARPSTTSITLYRFHGAVDACSARLKSRLITSNPLALSFGEKFEARSKSFSHFSHYDCVQSLSPTLTFNNDSDCLLSPLVGE
jgi:hypothetical protein